MFYHIPLLNIFVFICGEETFCIFVFYVINMSYLGSPSVTSRGACGWFVKSALKGWNLPWDS